MRIIYSIAILALLTMFLPSCALWSLVSKPDLEQEKIDRFHAATGHQLLRVYNKDDRLGYIYDKDVFVKRVWGGNKVTSSAGQSIKLTYTQKNFDKLKLFLGDNFSLGPQLTTVHHIIVHLEDIHKHELVDFQPLIEYMGEDSKPLIQRDFVVSMIKVTKFTVRAYEEVTGEFGAEYRPYPMFKIMGGTGTTSEKEDEHIGYNVFVGYKLYNGAQWWNSNFERMPKVSVSILKPEPDQLIDEVRARVKGRIPEYNTLDDRIKNQMRLYIMTRDEYKDDFVLQSKATINVDGQFEGVVKLGTLEEGNGHRYSVAAFVTYFDINRDVNSAIPVLPFNKGKHIIQVKREDDF